MPEERIRVVQATTGGGFGGKLDVTVEGFLALAVYHAQAAGRDALYQGRELPFQHKTAPPLYRVQHGCEEGRRPDRGEGEHHRRYGAYASYGDAVCLRTAVHAAGPYEVANVWADSRMFYTNNGPVSGAMRGFGVPQLAFAHESQLDEIAVTL